MISINDIINALALPDNCRVDQRVAKKLIIDQGLPTSADKKRVQEGIEEVYWVAALKPNRIGVSPWIDEIRSYREIVILTAKLRSKAKPTRLVEIIHRMVPHPVLLVTEQNTQISVSIAHKRYSQSEKAKTVLDGSPASVALLKGSDDPDNDFLASLAVSSLPSSNLFGMVKGWFDRIEALKAARITELFLVPGEEINSGKRSFLLEEWEKIQSELAALCKKANTEKQMNRRVDLNLEIKKLEAYKTNLVKQLRG